MQNDLPLGNKGTSISAKIIISYINDEWWASIINRRDADKAIQLRWTLFRQEYFIVWKWLTIMTIRHRGFFFQIKQSENHEACS